MTGIPQNGKHDNALWMPPGSVRGLIAIIMISITGLMLYIIISNVFIVKDEGDTVMIAVSSDLLMGIMGLLTTWFTLLGLVLKAYFDAGQKTDDTKRITEALMTPVPEIKKTEGG